MPLARQRPIVPSQCWLAEHAPQAAPDVPHWPFDWFA
jgi:hypothetical protein